MNESVNHRGHLIFTIKYILHNLIPIILTCVAYLSYFLYSNSKSIDPIIVLIFSFYVFIQVLVMTQLSFACLAVKERLKILNKHLK
jgi:cellulose synthase/poly-beta-1,6-N-acetylglucosamine synthase-like glycosyltransferase